MKPTSDSINETGIIKKITDEFTKFHAESSGHTPKRLRELTTSALVQGMSRSDVAKAAGVAPKTISNWARSVEPQAKQLNLISELAASAPPVSAEDGIAGRTESSPDIKEISNQLSSVLTSISSTKSESNY